MSFNVFDRILVEHTAVSGQARTVNHKHMRTFSGISAGPCMDPFLEEEKRDSNLFVSRTPQALLKKMVSFLPAWSLVTLIQYVTAEWKPAFLSQARELLFL